MSELAAIGSDSVVRDSSLDRTRADVEDLDVVFVEARFFRPQSIKPTDHRVLVRTVHGAKWHAHLAGKAADVDDADLALAALLGQHLLCQGDPAEEVHSHHLDVFLCAAHLAGQGPRAVATVVHEDVHRSAKELLRLGPLAGQRVEVPQVDCQDFRLTSTLLQSGLQLLGDVLELLLSPRGEDELCPLLGQQLCEALADARGGTRDPDDLAFVGRGWHGGGGAAGIAARPLDLLKLQKGEEEAGQGRATDALEEQIQSFGCHDDDYGWKIIGGGREI
mmetsp:Transcript_77085/g.160456  ORF Transcript_77085/g.160456 Transcript_77085/m.160456 type:complete len:277 (-) Transcript_77085:1-831(-)